MDKNKIIEKLMWVKNQISAVSWNGWMNPTSTLDEIVSEVSELKEENANLKGKLEVYEKKDKKDK